MSAARPRASGKFLSVGDDRFLVKGVTYGTFAPDANGCKFPPAAQVATDFALMAQHGFNTIRAYSLPPLEHLDIAANAGLRYMIGFEWPQHVAFLDDRRMCAGIRRDVVTRVREMADHPAVLMFVLGNEIPPPVVRWHGRRRIERFLHSLYDDVKSAAPEALCTYVNYPPTEYLELPFFDICSFNVYLHKQADLRAYLARLQHIAGPKPLLLAEVGADSIRNGEEGQAALTSVGLRTAFTEGACGAVAFTWTDAWWRGGSWVDDWAFGLVDRERRPKLALSATRQVFSSAPFRHEEQARWPKVSVVVCAYNAASTITACLSSLERLTYPNYEIIVVNDGSTDATAELARRHPRVKLIDGPNRGLSAARNLGLHAARGEIVAYTDADVRADQDWLTYLVRPFMDSDVVGAGGPNVVPPDDPWMAQCVARAPGGPTQVLLDDRIAEHVPGCNMAFKRGALLAIGGFDPVFARAGDDVDVCWRLQARGWTIGFAPSALVWHLHRPSIRAFWRQQLGYGEGEAWLRTKHPERFVGRGASWRGRVYSPLPYVRSMSEVRVNSGPWGSAPFPSVYRGDVRPFAYLPHLARWLCASVLLIVGGLAIGPLSPGWLGALLLSAGVIGIGITAGKCIRYAWQSDLGGLPDIGRLSRGASRVIYRATIAWLHVIQPLARARGRLRGLLHPVGREAQFGLRRWWRVDLATLRAVPTTLNLVVGRTVRERFWSETWISGHGLLDALADRLRVARITRRVELDEGWWPDRDISLEVGRWGRLDVKLLVEEHHAGRCLAAIRTRFHATAVSGGLVTVLALAAIAGTSVIPAAARSSVLTWASALALAGLVFAAARVSATVAAVREGVNGLAVEFGLYRLTRDGGVAAPPPQRPQAAAPSDVPAPAVRADQSRRRPLAAAPESVASFRAPRPPNRIDITVGK